MNKFSPSEFFFLNDFSHKDIFNECTFVWDVLSKIEDYLKNIPYFSIDVQIPEGAYIENPETVSIGRGTVVEPGAFIRGPCVIGENCSIRHGAYIRGNFISGVNCVIGHDTEIKNAIFLNHSHAAHFAYVGDSVLGNRVNLGAGTKCANLKFDKSEISLQDGHSRILTGLKKFGVICGDDSQIGCNAVTNPGTVIGKSVYCYPCVNFGGYVPDNSKVKSKEKALILKR